MDYYMPPGINGSDAALKIKQILHRNDLKSYPPINPYDNNSNHNKAKKCDSYII